MMETNTDAIFLKKPFLEDVCELVLPEKSKWKEIGNELWIIGCRPLPDLNLLTNLGLDEYADIPYCRGKLSENFENFKTSSDDEENLEEMFSNWIEGKYSEVSWNHLIEVLRKLEFLDVEKIKEFLREKKMVTKYEDVEVLTKPTMKTVYGFLYHDCKKDYSDILKQYGYNLRRKRSSDAEYEEPELELLVIVSFLNPSGIAVEWEELVNGLDSFNRYYDIIGKIIAYLESKGSSTDETLKTFKSKVDYKVVLLNDAMEVLSTRWSKQDDWYSIGRKLRVDREYLRKLKDGDQSNEKKLKDVLEWWLQDPSKRSPYYWGDFRSVIRDDLKYRDVANSINEILAPPKKENCNGGNKEAQPPDLSVQKLSPSKQLNALSVHTESTTDHKRSASELPDTATPYTKRPVLSEVNHNTQLNIQSNTDSSADKTSSSLGKRSFSDRTTTPCSNADILKECIGDLMRAVGDPCMLANDMWSKGLISFEVKDYVTSTLGLSTTDKMDKLLSKFYKTLCVQSCSETKPLMIKFCDALKKQSTDTLDSIISKMEKKLL